MQVKREHLAGLELALAIADTVCTDSIGVGELERLIEQAKAEEPVKFSNVNRYIQQEMQMSKPVEVVLAADYDQLLIRSQKLEAEVRKFAGFFSSDDVRHWQLHGLADDQEYDDALSADQ